jgi:hypothetical protein
VWLASSFLVLNCEKTLMTSKSFQRFKIPPQQQSYGAKNCKRSSMLLRCDRKVSAAAPINTSQKASFQHFSHKETFPCQPATWLTNLPASPRPLLLNATSLSFPDKEVTLLIKVSSGLTFSQQHGPNQFTLLRRRTSWYLWHTPARSILSSEKEHVRRAKEATEFNLESLSEHFLLQFCWRKGWSRARPRREAKQKQKLVAAREKSIFHPRASISLS